MNIFEANSTLIDEITTKVSSGDIDLQQLLEFFSFLSEDDGLSRMVVVGEYGKDFVKYINKLGFPCLHTTDSSFDGFKETDVAIGLTYDFSEDRLSDLLMGDAKLNAGKCITLSKKGVGKVSNIKLDCDSELQYLSLVGNLLSTVLYLFTEGA